MIGTASVGEKLTQIRRARKLTREQLAERSELPEELIQRGFQSCVAGGHGGSRFPLSVFRYPFKAKKPKAESSPSAMDNGFQTTDNG